MTKPDEIASFSQFSVVSHMLYMPKTLWLDPWAHFKVPIYLIFDIWFNSIWLELQAHKGRFHAKKVAVLLDFVQIIPPPKFGQLISLFLNAKNVDLSDFQNYYPKFFLNKGRILALWVMYTTYKQFKVQIISILEEIDSFSWPKIH